MHSSSVTSPPVRSVIALGPSTIATTRITAVPSVSGILPGRHRPSYIGKPSGHLCSAILVGALFLGATGALAQSPGPGTGFPPYGSFQAGGFDIVNLQNLNVNFAIPLVSSLGRGLDLRVAQPYNSLVRSVGSFRPPQCWTGKSASVRPLLKVTDWIVIVSRGVPLKDLLIIKGYCIPTFVPML